MFQPANGSCLTYSGEESSLAFSELHLGTVMQCPVTFQCGDTLYTTDIYRDDKNIYSYSFRHVTLVREQIEQSTRSTKQTRKRKRCAERRIIDDHFDEAIALYGYCDVISSPDNSHEPTEDNNPLEITCTMPSHDASDRDWDYFFENCKYEQYLDAPLDKAEEWEERKEQFLLSLSESLESDSEEPPKLEHTRTPNNSDVSSVDSVSSIENDSLDGTTECHMPALDASDKQWDSFFAHCAYTQFVEAPLEKFQEWEERQEKLALEAQEESDSDEDSFEEHSGFEYKLNPEFKELPERVTRAKIERKLAHAAKIKAEMMSITPAEIDLQAKLFDDKISKIRAEWQTKKLDYHPQDGEEDSIEYWLNKLDDLTDRMTTYSEVLSAKEVDHVIKHIERLILLFIELRETRSYSGMMAAILGYLQGLTGKSLFNTVREYLSDVLAMEAHEGEEGPDTTPRWLEIFRSVTSNWKSVTRMPAWRYLQRVLSVAVSAGLCKVADVNFRIGDMKLFTLKIDEKQASAFDLMDAILVTADYFVEAGYEAFKTRSIRPFFFDNQTARILDDSYLGISASMKALPTGDLGNTKYKTEAELIHVLENTLSGYIILRSQTRNQSEKRTLDARCMQLEEWKLQFIQQTVSGGLREQPYSIFLVGRPGIGKSMMTQVLVEVVLQANGIKYTQKQVATVNPGDKFASTVKNDTIVIILDDFGNFVLEFETENPLKYIIEICNNVVSYVPKAEANEKGKIAWRPKLVITTSNLDDLLFNKLSNAPGSARRRGIRMKPYLKEEYAEHNRFSEDKYRALNDDNLPAVADAYKIDIQEWGINKWEYLPFKEGDTKDLSYAEALEFHVVHSRKHFEKQRNYVKNHGSIRSQIVICPHGCVKSYCAECGTMEEDEPEISVDSAPSMEAHFGTETLGKWIWNWFLARLLTFIFPFTQSFSDWLRDSSNERLQTINDRLHYFSLFGFYDWLPDCVVETTWFENYLLFAKSTSILMKYWQLGLNFFLSFFLFLFLGPAIGGTMNGLVVWPYLVQCATMTHVKVIEEFRERRGALPVEFTRSRDKFLRYALTGAFVLTGLAAAYKLYSSSKVMEPHGNIQPRSMADIRKRDAEQSDWTKTVVEALPSSDKSKCIDHATLVSKVKKNLVYVNYDDENGKKKFVNGFFPCSNELLIPYHILTEKPRTYRIYRRGEHIRGAQFSESFSLSNASIHETKDIAMVQCCNTSPFEDLRPYFALEDHHATPFSVLFMQKDEVFVEGHGIAKSGTINNSIRTSKGYHYNLSNMSTFQGMCMATMVSETRAPQIIGFHIGGKTGTSAGCGVSMTANEYEEMRKGYYTKHISALEHISEGTVYTEHYGIEWYEGPQIHEKSPLNWLPDDCNIRYFGSCIGRTSYHSDVVPTTIADYITEVCGHEQEYSGPHFHRWKSWYESLVYSCNPTIGCDTDILDWAVSDYQQQLQSIFEVDGITEEVKKLSEIEIVSGKDGVRIINAMPPNTSCGYPLGGPKRGKMIELEPNEQHNCPRTFCTGVWEELRRFKAAIRSGQRYYPLFKACLKDEPTKIEKEKVRVFQAAPLSLQIAIREYFLPIARLLSLFPLVSECAVGINAQGTEWDALQSHVKKFGEKRIVAGDHAKYDLQMCAKYTSAAFKIMIDFAEWCGYSEEDLTMMRGIATEVVYPMMAYNGDLLMLQGSNPSGQNLTVYINSIVNSLVIRVGFRMIYPEFSGRFSDAVALTTYGDDFKSSGSEEYPEFHHVSLAEKLASIEMKITMPDKEAEPVPFLQDENCDFLKRHNRLHECGYYIGALDENSIFKSLKAVLRSKHISAKEQSAQNIDGALREWFLHGKDVYEKRRAEMKEVADKGEIAHMCYLLNDTFEDRMKVWQDKYMPLEFDEEIVYDEAISDMDEVVYSEHAGTECLEFVEIAVERMAEIHHVCFDGSEFLHFYPLPGPLLPTDYVQVFLVFLPILFAIFVYFMIAIFTLFTIHNFRDLVLPHILLLFANRRMEREMIGLTFEFLREHPHLAAVA